MANSLLLLRPAWRPGGAGAAAVPSGAADVATVVSNMSVITRSLRGRGGKCRRSGAGPLPRVSGADTGMIKVGRMSREHYPGA
ncbi:hypothetical protein GCM10010420_38050 [Streptomyces glaucosporus]|uniref:Uncharacterized protein n=1 Tax=Streptomyces glaucosporus TaxID=284044 RepID=A0ABP5VLH9_9ACTN